MSTDTGPGWSWLQVYSPWRDDSPIHCFDIHPTRRSARDDLQRHLDGDRELAVPARRLRGAVSGGQGLVMYHHDAYMWAWAIFPVAPGATSTAIGREFFTAWRAQLLTDGRAFIDSRGTTVVTLNGWFDPGKAPVT